jgi:hypothetical protein
MKTADFRSQLAKMRSDPGFIAALDHRADMTARLGPSRH